MFSTIGPMEIEVPENTTTFTRPNATFTERLIIGSIYCTFSSVFLFLQCSMLIIFFSYKEYYKNMCYRIMIVISIVDSVQLFVHFYGGIIAIFNSSINYWMEKILGGLLNSFCIVLFPLCLVLALERLLVYLPRYFSKRAETCLVSIMVGLCFVWALPFFIAYMTPYTGIIFRTYAWDYDDSTTDKWTFVQNIDESSSMPILAVNFVVYLLILGILMYKRKKNHLQSDNFAKLMAPHERRLLVQSLIQFFLELSLNTLWLFQAFGWLPDFPLSEAAINFYWIVFNGIKPILYIIFNAPIRGRILRLWMCKGVEKMKLTVHRPIADIMLLNKVAPIWMANRPITALEITNTAAYGGGRRIGRSFQMDKDIRYSNGQLLVTKQRNMSNAFSNQRTSLPSTFNSQ